LSNPPEKGGKLGEKNNEFTKIQTKYIEKEKKGK
jgi:hypothetical protein